MHEAKAICKKLGRKLFEPKNSYDYNKVLALARKKGVSYFWIGISDETTEGEFTYESNGKKIGYKNWSGGEPNNSGNNEDCVMGGWSKGAWNDYNCGSKLSFVCEKLPPGN